MSMILAVSFMCMPALAASSSTVVSFAKYTTNTSNSSFKVMGSLQGTVEYNSSGKAIFSTVYATNRYDSYEGKTSLPSYSSTLRMSIIVIGEYASGEYMPEINIAEQTVSDGNYISTGTKTISSYNVLYLVGQYSARVPNTLTYYTPDNLSIWSSTIMSEG
ncbi:MAG: hypothetical protein LUH54_03485 [Firmicutes bacterium]|nr:hypothetical protein [Bacillota bacterium]